MWLGLVGVLMSSVAVAADSNENGCDDAYEGNSACVANTASVDPTSTVGASSQILDHATVGPQTSIGSGVTIGARSSLAGRDDHSSNPISIGNDVIVGRSVTIGVDSVLGTGTTLARGVTAGSDLTTGTDVAVGYASEIGDNVTIGNSAVVGGLVELGDHVTVGTAAVIARGVTADDAGSAVDGSDIDGIVGPNVSIGSRVDIQSGARVRKGVTILDGVTLEGTARVGRDVTLGADSTIRGAVRPTAVVGAGATIGDGALVARGAEVCPSASVPDGETVDELYPPQGCVDATGCNAILQSGGSTGDGVYTIDPDGDGGAAPYDVYCDMTNDGGGWTLVANIRSGSTAHRDASSVGALASPGQGTPAKLADADINTLRGTDFLESVIRFTCGTETTYFQENKPFSATLLSGNAIDRCASTWDATTWYEATPYHSHGGLNTWQQDATCGYLIYTIGDNGYIGCYNGVQGHNNSGTMWVK